MRSRHTAGRRFVSGVTALGLSLVLMAPILWMVSASLKPDAAIHRHIDSPRSFVPSPITASNYADAAQRGSLRTVLLNTLLVVTLIAGGGLLLNAPAAYAFSRLRFPGRDMLFVIVVATMIVPLEAIVIPLFIGVRSTRGLTQVVGEHAWTMGALSVPFMAKAFNIFLLRQSFLSLPHSLEEAAYLDGAGLWQGYWRIALPNITPALATAVLLDFVIHWNDFLWPLVICQRADTRTIQLGLGNFFTQPPISWGAILAYAVVATLPVTLVFVVGQRWIVRSLASVGVRG